MALRRSIIIINLAYLVLVVGLLGGAWYGGTHGLPTGKVKLKAIGVYWISSAGGLSMSMSGV